MTEQQVQDEPEVLDSDDQAVEPAAKPEVDYEAEARDMGWRPKEEWKGDPDRWRPAEEFVRRGQEILPIVQSRLERERAEREKERKAYEERLRRIESTTEAALKRQQEAHDREMKAIDARLKQARADGDAEMVDRLWERKQELASQPVEPEKNDRRSDIPPETQAWVAENGWFQTDPAAKAVAVAEAGRVAAAGGDVAAQLAAARKAVERRFPEHFPQPSRAAQAVDAGGNAAPPARKARTKGWSDLPAEDRQMMERSFLRDPRFVESLGGMEKARETLAKDYWSQ